MLTRRKFIKNTGKGLVGTMLAGSLLDVEEASALENEAQKRLSFTQDRLMYTYKDLAPYIDALTMEIHYTKHHTAYIKSVNEAIIAENVMEQTGRDLFKDVASYSDKLRNNAGGAWNHNFFWESMTPKVGTPPSKLADMIQATFGSFEQFKEQFAQAAVTHFGSGWTWLVDHKGKMEIISTSNQDNPLMGPAQKTPLLGLDVWEHAYYLKYQNRRSEYVQNWWNVVHWDKVAERLI
ncbi:MULTISPECIES: superoxide dismutase [Olivibacter]|uniref:Superoxide dismutase n=1 Tax=Olivibacter jilunii TaxID=985016 RepID=A0ABW6B1G4_9SPHI|nr:superoxide dismutase [Pseudosphingobacterium sp.]